MPTTYTLTGKAGAIVARGNTLDVDIVNAITDATLTFSMSEASELSLTIEDRRLDVLRTGLFDPGTSTTKGSPLDYHRHKFEVRAVELTPEGALTVSARSLGVAKLKRPTPAKVTGGVSPSTWVATEGRREGLTVVAQPTPTAATVTIGQGETRWDTMTRLAKELGFVLFEAGGILTFAQPSWLLARKAQPSLTVDLDYAYQPKDGRILHRPSIRRSSDAPTRVVELEVEVLEDAAVGLLPGHALILNGVPYFAGRYIVDGVTHNLSDAGTVTVSASTPIDPTPEPPQKEAAVTGGGLAVGMTGGGGAVTSPGAGTYGGKKLTAEQVANATKIVRAAQKRHANRDALIICLMTSAVEAPWFASPDEAHSDRDSAGPFQQRRAWRRSEAQRRDYDISTGLFLNGGDDGQRGLFDVKNWQHRPKGVVCQVVQGSAYPDRYRHQETMATALVDAILATAQRSPSGANDTRVAASDKVEAFVQLALKQAGNRYIYGHEVRMSDPDPDTFDCSELVEWCAYRVGISPRVPDGTGGQAAFASKHGLWIPVERGIRTRGAILWKSGHTGISLGIGHDKHGTIEAMGRKYGVLRGSTKAGRWTRAWLLPGVRY